MYLPQIVESRTMFLEDLRLIIEKDELFMIKCLLGLELSVRCGKSESEIFNTDIGVPQGDGLSANEFTLYLAKTLYHEKYNDHKYHACTYKTATELISKLKCVCSIAMFRVFSYTIENFGISHYQRKIN